MPSSLGSWETLFHRSLATRLSPETFETYVTFLSSSSPRPPARVAELFLSPTKYNDISLDPRVPKYLLVLLQNGLVNIPTTLRVLWKVSSFHTLVGDAGSSLEDNEDTEKPDTRKGNEIKRWSNNYAAEETIFYALTKNISSGAAPKNPLEVAGVLVTCIQWMEGVLAANQAPHSMISLHHAHTEMNASIMALGTLVVSIVESAIVQTAISKGRVKKETRQSLEKSLTAFVPLLLQVSPQSAARLEVFRTETIVGIEPVDKRQAVVSKEIEDILEESMGAVGIEAMVVGEMPVVNSRAGLYVYFSSLLVGRPLIDDNAIFAYLHNRYQGDIRSTIVDLILAAFDILANANIRNERPQTTTILRSFLINKIPTMLTTLCTQLFPPLTSEFCITEALSQVDTTAFPTLSNMFDESSGNNMFSDSVRQDFCFACCLHDLIPESSIENLLGDIPMQSLPAGGRYVKEDLVHQCLSDPDRAEGLIEELENMDGNMGAVSQAIAEVITKLCRNKETMSLKTLCSQLAKKPSTLDVMLLFDKPRTILQPVCDLLDNWRYDEDQGEYQPVYEEFGSILLLVLSFTHRYNLSTIDLGIRSQDSFVAKLLNQGHLSRAFDDLTSPEASHLDGWICGLFDTESGGLGDELMSSCPPQDFYLLVPTLFHHVVLAYSTKNLSDESLKGGLEYLVDTFLLPSLVPGITWLSSHMWESLGDANAVLQILSALITNPANMSSNPEASQMLAAILNIIAKNLEHSLRWLQRAEPSRQDVEPLSKALRGHLGWERRGAAEHTELESWTATPAAGAGHSHGGGLVTSIRSTINHLVQWGQNPGLNVNPASYTHRQLLVTVRMLGAKRVLGIILEEVKSETGKGNASVVLDVAAALVCAPDAASWDGSSPGIGGAQLQRRINLREALKNEADSAPKAHKTDVFHAESIVRLYRKVEAQLLMPQLAHDAVVLQSLDGAMTGVNISSVGMDGLVATDGLGLDTGMGGDLMGDMGMGVSDSGADLMHDLLGGGGGGDLTLDGFGDGGMGDGLGF